jgi:hypothetical protein
MANKRKESEAATNLKNKELPIEKGSQQTDRASFLEDLAGVNISSNFFFLSDLLRVLLVDFVRQLPKTCSKQYRILPE